MPKSSSRSRPGAPRLDPEYRLISRFYEPLVLLHALGRVRGDHISIDQPGTLPRKFLNGLAYTCDYRKGGTTVTAIGLEGTPQGVVYWIAANEDPKKRILSFVKPLLEHLEKLATCPPNERQSIKTLILYDVVNFHKSRIKDYWSLFIRARKACMTKLKKGGDRQEMEHWLSNLYNDVQEDHMKLCGAAAETRISSPHWDDLRKLSESESDDSKEFSEVRHCIGRLGSQVKTVSILCQTAIQVPALLFEHQVESLPPQGDVSHPAADAKTNLSSMLGRMVPSRAILDTYKDSIMWLKNMGLEKRILEIYNNTNWRPRVHAELIVLEHFFTEDLKFHNNDRFIGCSKPACYCCYHYICVHPGNFIRPPCHNKNYLSWRPPDGDGSKEANKHRQTMLNALSKEIRRDVLDQISQRTRFNGRHQHDTTTGTSLLAHDMPIHQSLHTEFESSPNDAENAPSILEGQFIEDPANDRSTTGVFEGSGEPSKNLYDNEDFKVNLSIDLAHLQISPMSKPDRPVEDSDSDGGVVL